MADNLPILCVDILLRNDQKEYLLIKRMNEPKKDRWWPVGGRVHKNENILVAAHRKVREEVGLPVRVLRPVGYYQCYGLKGQFGISSYHTVSIVFLGSVHKEEVITLDNQSSGWKFSKGLPVDFDVHPFVNEDGIME